MSKMFTFRRPSSGLVGAEPAEFRMNLAAPRLEDTRSRRLAVSEAGPLLDGVTELLSSPLLTVVRASSAKAGMELKCSVGMDI